MSLTYESPTRANGQNDAYFTPMNTPNIMNNAQVNNTNATPATATSANEPILNNSGNNNYNNTVGSGNSSVNTPYFTAPLNPALHQEFLNAIHARHASQPTVLTSPPISSPNANPVHTPPLASSSGGPGGFNLTLSVLANGRQNSPSTIDEQQHLQQQRQRLQQAQALSSSILLPIDPQELNQMLNRYNDASSLTTTLLVLDVRSFVQYSHSRIRGSINVSIPNTILKRPTFTLDKVYEAIVLDNARERLRSWNATEYIVFYDQQSQILLENSAAAYLGNKLTRAGFNGQLFYLKGGFDTFSTMFKESCESNATSFSNGNGTASATSHFGPPTIGGDSFSLKLPASNGTRPKLRLNNMPLAPTLGPFTAPMPQFENQAFNPFFSNIRQNMELSHGPIRERFPVRLPPKCYIVENSDRYVQITKDIVPRRFSSIAEEKEGGSRAEKHDGMDDKDLILFKPPKWLFSIIGEEGTQLLAQTYERLERTEQRRLQNIMHFHSKHTDNPAEYPFSIVAGLEMGALNRYTNIWPFAEYTRVKIRKPNNGSSDYINASYVQYIDTDDCVSDARPELINTQAVNIMKKHAGNQDSPQQQPYSRYISTQGPLPTTFNDFWQVVWEQNSRVLVMLTKEEEMNKIKCHRYWPSQIDVPTQYGNLTITLVKENSYQVQRLDTDDHINEDDVVIVRHLTISKGEDNREITHLQYTGWMDFGVPDNPLGTLQLIQMADKVQADYSHEIQPRSIGPMIVHCSAGCGRSGAFCAIDTVIYRLSTTAYKESVDDTTDILLQTISRFREQRLSMVQTLRQFVFCYEAIWWWILGYGSHNDRRRIVSSSSPQPQQQEPLKEATENMDTSL
ncbi:protein-tyrosine phosphatase-like protein [Mycotypha africana]|uniref:protein-tyrosine phosphatase-like protein n=1 Tax=Mycotypha africana TaxID=64632 RepID=UPI0023018802|nr:protein-tyrosine phosphatase-like protein [Mycotypha africana]KAI8990941.1 protein-tyrosine phosphatase-like protein [Mycotypha africana]